MPALALWTPEDGVLGAVAPLALALAVPTALVVDLDPAGPRYPGDASLAKLVANGPRRVDLEPSRTGLAVLRNGGIAAAEAAEVTAALAAGWPHVVFRLPPAAPASAPAPVVEIRPLLPGALWQPRRRAAVHQRAGWRVPPAGPGPVLPRPRAATLHALLTGRRPVPDPWLRAWRPVWSYPWR